jgi:hypothetical protein
MRVDIGHSPKLSAFLTLMVLIAVPAGPVGTAVASHDCTFGHSLVLSMSNTAGLTDNDLGCQLFHGETDTDTVDNNETANELVTRAANTIEHSEVFLTNVENQLQYVNSTARIEAQAAYYRALENGDTRSGARTKAHQAVRDFLTIKQMQLVNSWNLLTDNWGSYDQLEDDEGLGDNFVVTTGTDSGNDLSTRKDTINGINGTNIEVTVVDGSAGAWFDIRDDSARTLQVATSNSTYTDQVSSEVGRYTRAWNQLQAAETKVIDEIDSYINQTYDSYQEGDVNSTDLVDANTLTQEFSPQEHGIQSWTTLALSSTSGVDPPDNLDGLGSFTIEYNGANYTGLLLADTEQTSQIQAGSTYDGSTWNITPKVVTDNQKVELSGNFTVHEITNQDGETLQNVTYVETNYSTTNISDFQQTLDRLEKLRTEIEARESDSGGGGALLGSSGNLILGLAALGAIVLLMRQQNGGGRPRHRGR